MRTANTILELIKERGKKGLPLERVYRLLFNRDLYLKAYGKIYRNKGAMTHGVTEETPDDMSLAKIEAIIEALRYERYQWLPARRTYIPKKNGGKRPLGMPVWSDKLVQEVLRLILEAYFEPQFSDHSHGFRPERGCHTALREIYRAWRGTTWFIEGDISHCFDKLSHELLIEALKEHIHDGRFIRFMQELLDAGYMEDWTFNETRSGVPQGGVVHASYNVAKKVLEWEFKEEIPRSRLRAAYGEGFQRGPTPLRSTERRGILAGRDSTRCPSLLARGPRSWRWPSCLNPHALHTTASKQPTLTWFRRCAVGSPALHLKLIPTLPHQMQKGMLNESHPGCHVCSCLF